MKFILIADSICGGFGQRSGKSFVHYSLSDLGFEKSLVDYSRSGMTTTDFLEKSEIGFILRSINSSDFVIISLGNVDSKPVYTKNNFFHFLFQEDTEPKSLIRGHTIRHHDYAGCLKSLTIISE